MHETPQEVLYQVYVYFNRFKHLMSQDKEFTQSVLRYFRKDSNGITEQIRDKVDFEIEHGVESPAPKQMFSEFFEDNETNAEYYYSLSTGIAEEKKPNEPYHHMSGAFDH